MTILIACSLVSGLAIGAPALIASSCLIAAARYGILVESTEDLLRLQSELLDAVAPFTEKTGTAAAFVSTDGGRDIQQGLIDYVADFTAVAAGKKFNPHITIGVAPETYLNEMLAEPFKAFAFSLAGTAVYQLGSFGAARKELQALSQTP